MKASAVNDEMERKRSDPKTEVDQYYSVEFSVDGPAVTYQFKIWDVASMSMCLLIKDGSELLSRIKVGDKLKMKYYCRDSNYPSNALETTIRHITRNDQGRFKGHYLVGLEIL